jgi:hypothetical protein
VLEDPTDSLSAPYLAAGGLEPAEREGLLVGQVLLHSTVIALSDGLEYVIDRGAAKDLVAQHTTITLVRLSDRVRVAISSTDLIQAISEGDVFDQLDV